MRDEEIHTAYCKRVRPTRAGTYTRTDGTTGNMADVNLMMDRFKREFANKLDTSSVTHLPDMQGSGVLRDLREAVNDGDWRVVA